MPELKISWHALANNLTQHDTSSEINVTQNESEMTCSIHQLPRNDVTWMKESWILTKEDGWRDVWVKVLCSARKLHSNG